MQCNGQVNIWSVTINRNKFTFLYTNIGRGHPFYLDGIIEELIRTGRNRPASGIIRVRKETDVFEISRNISLFAWKAVRWLYAHGASSGLVGRFYSALRRNNNYNKDSFSLRLLGRDIRKVCSISDEPLIVAHPSLVGILRDRPNLIYQHGELIAPSEAIAQGASIVIVPTEEVAKLFSTGGYTSDQIFISGLCIEPPIARQAETAYEVRIERLQSSRPMTGALFSSGAEPQVHVDLIVSAATSIVEEGGNAIVFAKKDGMLAGCLNSVMNRTANHCKKLDATDQIPISLSGLWLIEHRNRREENALTARLFPLLDYFVSPAHERSNWAIGLGLPMFILNPCYGPFAPMNKELLLSKGVAQVILDRVAADRIGKQVQSLRKTGELLKMAQRGWSREKIDGFAKIAEFLLNKYPV